MLRRRSIALLVACLTLTGAAGAQAAPELSVSDRLQDRRYLASSERAYSVGFEDGRFYANGWHITGEMGGVWTPPLKLVDGVWFGIGDEWIGPATEFRSGWGYAEMDLPQTAGLRLHRTVVESGLRLRDLTVGHTVPRDAQVTQVLLDGNEVRRPILRETNRGLEVLAEVPGDGRGRHVLVVVAD